MFFMIQGQLFYSISTHNGKPLRMTMMVHNTGTRDYDGASVSRRLCVDFNQRLFKLDRFSIRQWFQSSSAKPNVSSSSSAPPS